MKARPTGEIVLRLVRETLALPADSDLRPDQLLFYDLAFTSMDLLDLLFRVEEHFGVAIPEGTLLALARGGMRDDEFARDSLLTPAGRRRLMALLHDSPPAIFPERIHTSTLPRYCTLAAIVRLVEARLRERG